MDTTLSTPYVDRVDEWRWDLGLDGVVRLVSDGGVETVYVGSRIAARTTAQVDEHRVSLARRGDPSDGLEGAYRRTEAPARELQLRRVPRGWIGMLDGPTLSPTVSLEAAALGAPVAIEQDETFRRKMLIGVGIACALVGAVAVYSFASPTGFLHVARERAALLAVPHETDLATTLSTDNGGVTVRAPSDFRVDRATDSSLRLVRKELAEAFYVQIVPSPRTSDLDVVLHAVTDAEKEMAAHDPNLQDFKVDFSEPASAPCNGEPGRELTGTFVSGAGRIARLWTCASLRPGVGIGEHLASIQIFEALFPDPLAARDEPLFRSMMASTTIRDDAFSLGGVPPLARPPERAAPFMFPPTVLGGPSHITQVQRAR